jgi:hypothetical protein
MTEIQNLVFAATKKNIRASKRKHVNRGENKNRRANKSKQNKVAAKHEIISRRADKVNLNNLYGITTPPYQK